MSATTPSAMTGQVWRTPAIEREREAWDLHRSALGGSALSLPLPKARLARATFLHGFLLPFSLIVATLRHRTLGMAYLRLLVFRALAVGVLSSIVFHLPNVRPDRAPPHVAPIGAAGTTNPAPPPIHVRQPGLHVDIAEGNKKQRIEVLGHDLAKESAADEEEPSWVPRPALDLVRSVGSGWAWVVWFVSILSAIEGFIVFFSRRWDDWLGHHAASIAGIRPEDAEPKAPRLAFEPRYLLRKMKRRVRGYVVFAAGVPLFAVLHLVPEIGKVLFGIGLTLWGWYWLAVFSAAKSAHAWADDGVAPSPLLVRELRDRSAELRLLAPVTLYARLWARITRSVNAACLTFERSPAPFLGLALARVILSLPGVYLLARPIVPVAAGRLCAEADPLDRFSS